MLMQHQQQKQADRGHKQFERTSEAFAQDRRAPLQRIERDAAAQLQRERGRALVGTSNDGLPQRQAFGVRLRARDAGLQADRNLKALRPVEREAREQRQRARRHAHVGGRVHGQAVDAARHYADDHECVALDRQGPAQRLRIAMESSLPEAVAQHGRKSAGVPGIRRRERTSVQCPHAQGIEELRSDQGGGDLLCRQRRRHGEVRRFSKLPEHVLERRGVVAQRLIINVVKAAESPDPREMLGDPRQPFRMARRQWPQEQGVEQAEDCRARTNPQRQQPGDGQRRTRRLAQHPQADAKVVHDGPF